MSHFMGFLNHYFPENIHTPLFSSFIIILFLYKKLYILQLDWPADSNASLGRPVDQ